jgi:hypothetical protein
MRADALIIHDLAFKVVEVPKTQPTVQERIEGRHVTLVATSLRGGMSTAGEAVFGRELLLAAHPAAANAVLLMGHVAVGMERAHRPVGDLEGLLRQLRSAGRSSLSNTSPTVPGRVPCDRVAETPRHQRRAPSCISCTEPKSRPRQKLSRT